METPEVRDEATSAAILAAGDTARRVVANVSQVIHAPDEMLERCVLALLCEGHMIIEDFPGVGKTMLAKSSRARSTASSRASRPRPTCCRPTSPGSACSTCRATSSSSGPGRCSPNIVLVDEINRASPKTQSALLECMQEAQVTVDGETYPLERAVHGASRRRTRSSTRAPSRCPRPSSTASRCCSPRLSRRRPTRPRCCPSSAPASRSRRSRPVTDRDEIGPPSPPSRRSTSRRA